MSSSQKSAAINISSSTGSRKASLVQGSLSGGASLSPRSSSAGKRPSLQNGAGQIQEAINQRARKVQIGFTPGSPSTTNPLQSTQSAEMMSTSYKSQIPGWSEQPNQQIPVKSQNVQALVAPPSSYNKQATPVMEVPLANPSETLVQPADKPVSKADKKAQKAARRAATVGIKPANQQQQDKSVQDHIQIKTQNLASPASTTGSSENSQPPASATGRTRKQSTMLNSSSSDNKRNPPPTPKDPPQPSSQKTKEVPLFAHLSYNTRHSKASEQLRQEMKSKNQPLHPAIIKIGHQYQHFKIIGSNNRAIAMLQTFRQVIADYSTPQNNTLCRHLDSYLKPQINYLVSCRPISVSMGNAIRYLKMEIASIPVDMPEDDAKKYLDDRIVMFIRDRIFCAQTVICELAAEKIRQGDVILVYGCSSVVKKLLIHARQECNNTGFRVIVVDSRPMLEGKKMIEALCEVGVECTYVHLNALSYVLKETTKVIIGAHALLSNGYVMSRVGTAMLTLMAHEKRIPIICCCETYKFSDRVQLDSFVMNELGDVEDLVNTHPYPKLKDTVLIPPAPEPVDKSTAVTKEPSDSGNILSGWKDMPDLKLLNLLYDVTPSAFITVVITEVGLIPCSSVPVVLREGVKAASAPLSHSGIRHSISV